MSVLFYKIKQDEALTEYGDYNNYLNEGDPNIPIKGVDNGVFDPSELGVRTVDDFGVVGASVDAAMIASNKGTTYGRIRSMISEGTVKYALEEPEATSGSSLVSPRLWRMLINTVQLVKAGRLALMRSSKLVTTW